MKRGSLNLLAAIAVAGLGVAANLLFGAVPPIQSPAPPVSAAWQLPQGQVLDFDRLDARWEARAPWPAPPKPVEAAAVAVDEPPPALPIGIARGKRGPEAIFSVPGAGELSLPAGGRLPDGGRVLHVSGLRVEWVDGKGRNQQREMFNTYQIQEVDPASPAGQPQPAAKPTSRR